MSDATSLEWLATAVEQASRTAKFCVAGLLPQVDCGLEVDGLGAIQLPLQRGKAKELLSVCKIAPYGKGTKTLVNTKVRNTFELDPEKFHLGADWNAAIASTMQSVANELGLPAERLEAKLYKLLVYEKGGFFLPHRDSEKHNRMVASMIVVLPNPFDGGQLVVRHGVREQKFAFEEAAAGKMAGYVAFYADCEHEVRNVHAGVRICLAYNLVLTPKRRNKPTATDKSAPPTNELAMAMGSWVGKHPAEPLVFALEHQYTNSGLKLDLLKGTDRELAQEIVHAAEGMNCAVSLAQVSRHLLQFADDGSFDHGYSRRVRRPRRALQIGEVFEDDLQGTQWTSLEGKEQPWGSIPLETSAIVSRVPLDKWKPTSEDYEGYTGNAGNTLDRWYHRSAIVVWRHDRHFEVLAQAGAADCIPRFCAMAAKLAKTPRKRRADAQRDCLRFALAIIACWPRRMSGFWRAGQAEVSAFDDFPEHLLMLHDRDVIATFLAAVAKQDESIELNAFVLAACREFGWSSFAPQLKELLSPRSRPMGPRELPLRDYQWLTAYCADRTVDAEKSALASELCALAVNFFCEPIPPRASFHNEWQHRREPSVVELALPWLLKALLAAGREADLSRVLDFIEVAPREFRLEECQIPAVKTLIPWSLKQLGAIPRRLSAWRDSVRQQLEAATARPPAPPSNWSRPAEVVCNCKYCAQLNAFLANADEEVGRIAAREDLRQHVINAIMRYRCDVDYTTERKGSPHALVLTKTTGSHDRATKQYARNLKLLEALPTEAGK